MRSFPSFCGLLAATTIATAALATTTPKPIPDCHWADYNPDAREVTTQPVAPNFSTLNMEGRTDAFDSKLLTQPGGPPVTDKALAGRIHERMIEALARYGVRPEHIKLLKMSDNTYHIFTSLVDVPDVRIRRHIVYHAERFNLRPLFSKIEGLNAAARSSFFDLPPELGAELVNRLSGNDFILMNHWFAKVDPSERSMRKLIGCK